MSNEIPKQTSDDLLMITLVPPSMNRLADVDGWIEKAEYEDRALPSVMLHQYITSRLRVDVGTDRNRYLTLYQESKYSVFRTPLVKFANQADSDHANLRAVSFIARILVELQAVDRHVTIRISSGEVVTVVKIDQFLIRFPRWTSWEWAKFTTALLQYQQEAVCERVRGLSGRCNTALEKSFA